MGSTTLGDVCEGTSISSVSKVCVARGGHKQGKYIYSRLKSELFLNAIKKTVIDCAEMKSLILSHTAQWHVPPYVTICKRDDRSSLMWFWLGSFVTNKHVLHRLGKRFIMCPSCKERETAKHILFECSITQSFRTLRQLTVNQIRFSEDPSFLASMGTYMSKVRNL
jgi:hypothetical protein